MQSVVEWELLFFQPTFSGTHWCNQKPLLGVRSVGVTLKPKTYKKKSKKNQPIIKYVCSNDFMFMF